MYTQYTSTARATLLLVRVVAAAAVTPRGTQRQQQQQLIRVAVLLALRGDNTTHAGQANP